MKLLIDGITATKKWISKIGIGLGFMAATAVGILGGIDAALMFPSIRLPIGFIIGGASWFVNAVSYFYVVSQKDSSNLLHKESNYVHKNTIGSTSFAVAATFFIGTTFVANYVGMYIGFTVLGGKLDLNWPDIALQIPGVVFGVSSAVSGLIFNIKVAFNLWNRIREKNINNLPAMESPLLSEINIEQPNYLSTTTLKRRLNAQINSNASELIINDDFQASPINPELSSSKLKPSFFVRRTGKLTAPATLENINHHKRSNSM